MPNSIRKLAERVKEIDLSKDSPAAVSQHVYEIVQEVSGVHDPYVEHWYEFEKQDVYPAPGHSWSRFFRNQDELINLRVQKDLPEALKGAEAMILAVPHSPYVDLDPKKVVQWAGHPLAVVDCFGILTDDQIREYFQLGCEVKALGRGHIQRIKEEVRKKR